MDWLKLKDESNPIIYSSSADVAEGVLLRPPLSSYRPVSIAVINLYFQGCQCALRVCWATANSLGA